MSQIKIEELFGTIYNSDNGSINLDNMPEELQDKIQELKGQELRNSGYSYINGVIAVTDAAKAEAFTKRFMTDLEKQNNQGDEDLAQAWLKSQTTITEAQRGEDVPMLIRDVVIRRSRSDRSKIFGIGLRGVNTDGKGIKLSLNRQYIAQILKNDRNASLSEKEIIAYGEEQLKNKWIVLGTTISIKGKTGYYANPAQLSDAEEEAMKKAGDAQMRNRLGLYGFIHQMSGTRYNLAGVCDEAESKIYQRAYELSLEHIAKEKEKESITRGEEKGKTAGLQAKLASLQVLLADGLIDDAEYAVMRAQVINKGFGG